MWSKEGVFAGTPPHMKKKGSEKHLVLHTGWNVLNPLIIVRLPVSIIVDVLHLGVNWSCKSNADTFTQSKSIGVYSLTAVRTLRHSLCLVGCFPMHLKGKA